MIKQQKYIILDFGLVLGKPKTGEWFITPNFFEILRTEKIDLKKLKFLFSSERTAKCSGYLSNTLDISR